MSYNFHQRSNRPRWKFNQDRLISREKVLANGRRGHWQSVTSQNYQNISATRRSLVRSIKRSRSNHRYLPCEISARSLYIATIKGIPSTSREITRLRSIFLSPPLLFPSKYNTNLWRSSLYALYLISISVFLFLSLPFLSSPPSCTKARRHLRDPICGKKERELESWKGRERERERERKSCVRSRKKINAACTT